MSGYRVLSLDGGGVRGILTSRLLERLEAEQPGFLASIDLIAGTSTGGILSLALAAGLPPAEISEMYRSKSGDIFEPDVFDAAADADRLVHSDYSANRLRSALADKFGDMALGDLEKHVVISAFDLDSAVVTKSGVRSWKAKFFQNFEGDPGDRSHRVIDVAMRTTAAPTYFPIYEGFIDGWSRTTPPCAGSRRRSTPRPAARSSTPCRCSRSAPA